MTQPAANPTFPNFEVPTPELAGLSRKEQWNLTAPLFPARQEKTVLQMVLEQVKATPDAPAIVEHGHALTYQELDKRSTQLAAQLRCLGVGTEVLVGICLERSVSMLVAVMGIFKAGGAYVPLDPSYPADRLAYMLNDASPRVVVTRSDLAERLPQGEWEYLTLDRLEDHAAFDSPDFSDCAPAPHGLAYVIYTSGSTGNPKGVEVTHASLRSLVEWHQRAFDVKPVDRATHLASPSFDASVWEVWPYLAMGASVHLPEDSARTNPEALRDWLVAQSITVSFAPTPMAERLLALHWPAETALRFLLTGGDMLHRYPSVGLPFQLVNNYGPTESTVVATSGVVMPDSRPSVAPPVGRPIVGTHIHILDENMQPVPLGQVGEVHIGGAGLARGYRNQPEITRLKFVPNPFARNRNERLYKTGDLGRWLADGQIELVGRADDQIKIRGFRIEPNEITDALNTHPAVQASIAVARADKAGEKTLVVYVVLRPQSSVTANELREALRSKLPEYMLPSAFVQLGAFPMTPNGKVDRAALPAPDSSNSLRDATASAPQTSVEIEVAKILANLLEIDGVSRDDNFFLLGGHSLMGTQLIVKLRGVFGVNMSLSTLFDRPTVEAIAAEIERLLPSARAA